MDRFWALVDKDLLTLTRKDIEACRPYLGMQFETSLHRVAVKWRYMLLSEQHKSVCSLREFSQHLGSIGLPLDY